MVLPITPESPLGALCKGFRLAVLVHVPDLATDEGFIHLNWAIAAEFPCSFVSAFARRSRCSMNQADF